MFRLERSVMGRACHVIHRSPFSKELGHKLLYGRLHSTFKLYRRVSRHLLLAEWADCMATTRALESHVRDCRHSLADAECEPYIAAVLA